jgi:enediyne biosynthesis protein E5
VAGRWYGSERLGGLRRFAAAITLLNVLGHLWLGFEQAPIQPFVGVLAAYATEIVLELVDATARRRPVRFLPRRLGGAGESPIDFLLSAHITGLAVSMLLYANERLAPIAFAAAVAIASKAVFRVRVDGRPRHWLNPSNFGISTTLLLFPWVGIAPPYMFTENLGPTGDVLLPCVVVVLGSLLNARYTRRLPLIAAWVGGFALQAALRHLWLGQPLLATWMPMGGMAYLLFTFYMVTDPATTPARPAAQVAFGLTVAATYGLLMVLHVVFGLFFALVIVCAGRGLLLLAATALQAAREGAARPQALGPAPVTTAAGRELGAELAVRAGTTEVGT